MALTITPATNILNNIDADNLRRACFDILMSVTILHAGGNMTASEAANYLAERRRLNSSQAEFTSKYDQAVAHELLPRRAPAGGPGHNEGKPVAGPGQQRFALAGKKVITAGRK